MKQSHRAVYTRETKMYRDHANTRQEVAVVGAIFTAFVAASVMIAAAYAAFIHAGFSF